MNVLFPSPGEGGDADRFAASSLSPDTEGPGANQQPALTAAAGRLRWPLGHLAHLAEYPALGENGPLKKAPAANPPGSLTTPLQSTRGQRRRDGGWEPAFPLGWAAERRTPAAKSPIC